MPQHHLEGAGPAEIPYRELRAAGMCSSADKGVAGRESGQGTGDGYRWGATPNRWQHQNEHQQNRDELARSWLCWLNSIFGNTALQTPFIHHTLSLSGKKRNRSGQWRGRAVQERGSCRGLSPTKEDVLAGSARSGMQKSKCLPLREDEVKARSSQLWAGSLEVTGSKAAWWEEQNLAQIRKPRQQRFLIAALSQDMFTTTLCKRIRDKRQGRKTF